MNRTRRWTALAAALLLLLVPGIQSIAEVTAEKTETRGKVTEITWKDENGNITAGPDGYAVVRYAYKGQETTEKYYDADNLPFRTEGGYHGRIVVADGRGNISSISYIGIDGKLTLNSMGYAKVLYRYFMNKEEREVIYFGADGKTPVIVPSLGYAQMETKHRGNVFIGRVYMDSKGNPVDIPAGYASLEIQLGKKTSAPKKIWYEHADGSPATGPDGWSICEVDLDAKGKPTKYTYLDEQGKMTEQGGCAWEEFRYGKENTVTVTRYSLDGNKIPYDGEAVSVRRKMKGDKIAEETYLNDAGEPVTLSGGYTTVSYSYNDSGDLETTQYRDSEGNRTTCRQGYSAIRETRDADGKLISRTYLDISGKAVNSNSTGVSEEQYVYDEYGRLKQIRRFDAAGNEIVSRN